MVSERESLVKKLVVGNWWLSNAYITGGRLGPECYLSKCGSQHKMVLFSLNISSPLVPFLTKNVELKISNRSDYRWKCWRHQSNGELALCGLSDSLLSSNMFRKCDYSRNRMMIGFLPACKQALLSIQKQKHNYMEAEQEDLQVSAEEEELLSRLTSHQSGGSRLPMAQMSAGEQSPQGQRHDPSQQARWINRTQVRGSGTDTDHNHHSAKHSADRSSGGSSSTGVAADISQKVIGPFCPAFCLWWPCLQCCGSGHFCVVLISFRPEHSLVFALSRFRMQHPQRW